MSTFCTKMYTPAQHARVHNYLFSSRSAAEGWPALPSLELLASLKKYRADSLDTPILLWLRCYPRFYLFVAVPTRVPETGRFVPRAAVFMGPL